jgi:hypothetical protein
MSAIAKIFLRQKSSNLKYKYKKALTLNFCTKKGERTVLVKLTPGVRKERTLGGL